MTDSKQEQREYGEQIFTAFALLKLLKAEGNPAAELLIYDIKGASTAQAWRQMKKWGIERRKAASKSIFEGAKLLAPPI